MPKKRVVIVGAGPGGLTTAVLLAYHGYEVEVFERQDRVGGRCSHLDVGAYRFDLGPTFLMMKYILDGIFGEVGRKSQDYLDFVHLDPMYRLYYPDGRTLDVTDDRDRMRENLARVFPGNESGLDKFIRNEGRRFDMLAPCFAQDFSSIGQLFGKNLRRALPYIPLTKSVAGMLARYFKTPEAQLAFMFQTKYLGMSPWACPGAFTIIPYVEHAFGVWHVRGGLACISEALAKLATELGAKIHLNTPVHRIEVENGEAVAVKLESKDRVTADAFVLNADFGNVMTELIPHDALKKYNPTNLRKKRFSCSTYMLYLGVDKRYEHLAHHNIVFANDYRKNIRQVFSGQGLSDDTSFYLRDSSAIDGSAAPAGHSALYVLVPVPNRKSKVDWQTEREGFREVVLSTVERRLNLLDLRAHIKEERVVTPVDWEHKYRVYLGATFNLSHDFGQMLWLRPHNEFEDLKNVYLAGGGTHPGSGLPTIIQSGWISAGLIARKFK